MEKKQQYTIEWTLSGYISVSCFPLLSKIALSVLTISRSNAAEEKVFSMIKKQNKTEFRANLDLSKTLDSVMVIKMIHPEQMIPCYSMRFSNELLKKCKSTCSV